MSEGLHVSYPVEGVVLIELDAPPANALAHETRLRLEKEIDAIEHNLGVRAVVLTGRGKGFCAGDDLREAQTRKDAPIASMEQFGRMLDKIERLRVPVIAAVNGHAIGGGLELALCCDLRVASPQGWFLGAGVNIGLMASTYRLPRLIGIGPAKAMLLTGLRVDAATALRYGLVTEIYDADELLSNALALATRIATRGPLAVEAAKRMIGQAFDLAPSEAASVAELEWHKLATSNDYKIGLSAFATRQEPKFTRS